MWKRSTLTSGYDLAIASTRSSQYGMVIEMPLLLVAEVSLRRGRCIACSKANFSTRSTPMRDMMVCCITISRSLPSYMRPPMLEYSPSVFSRTISMSMSPGFSGWPCRSTSGERMPGMSRAGRRLTYWSKSRRNFSSEPHSDTWSGTVAGQPMAPKKMASWPPMRSFQSAGIISPCFAK